MKVHIIHAAAAAAVLLGGCAKDSEQHPAKKHLIRVSAAVADRTKATDLSFETGDKFGLYATVRPGSLAGTRYLNNEPCTQGDDGVELAPKHYPDGTVDFYAYYPFGQEGIAPGSTALPFTVKSDQSRTRAYTMSDLMLARAEGIDARESAVPLLFDHVLARIDVRLLPGEGFVGPEELEGATLVAKGLLSRCTLDLADGTVSAADTPADIIPDGNGVKVESGSASRMRLIAAPQTVAAGQELFEITVGGTVFTFVQKEEKALPPGSRSLFEITLNRAAASAAGRLTVHPE